MEQSNITTMSGSLDKLAKLLAAENITVEHRQVKTAHFDLKTRTVVLPIWQNMEITLYHMLTFHEVGHALYTNPEEWHEAIEDAGRRFSPNVKGTYKNYLNVVEDARIERKIKTKFPGSLRDFVEGYNGLHGRDFFGIKDFKGRYYTLPLIDRINLYFKLGSRIQIVFSAEEQVFVDRAAKTMTWNDVVQLTDDIFQYSKDKKQEQEEEGQTSTKGMSGQSDDDDDGADQSDHDDMSDDDDVMSDDGSSNSDYDEVSDEDGDEDTNTSNNKYDEDHDGDENNAERSLTTEAGERGMEDLLDPKANDISIQYINLHHINHEPFTTSYKEVIASFNKEVNAKSYVFASDMNAVSSHLFNKFRNTNINAVNYLVKEFEMKKAADAYSRARTAKSGTIDMKKLHSFKFNDDLFKKISVVPNGKSHALVIYVDFSGSMIKNFLGVVDQLATLVMFCRRVNIPHRIFGFCTSYGTSKSIAEVNRIKRKYAYSDHGYLVPDCVRLVELFSNEMTTTEFNSMIKLMLVFGRYVSGDTTEDLPTICGTSSEFRDFHQHSYYSLREMFKHFNMGSTPLSSSMLLVRDIVSKLRNKTGAQIVNFVCITDGESDALMYGQRGQSRRKRKRFKKWEKSTYSYLTSGPKKRLTVIDTVTKKSYQVPRLSSTLNQMSVQLRLINTIIRDSTDINFIGFYIGTRSRDVTKAITRYVGTNTKSGMKNGCVAHSNVLGYNEYYFILGGKNLQIINNLDQEVREFSKKELQKDFMAMNKKRGASRIILSRFIDKIAA